MGRARRKWSEEEDEALRAAVVRAGQQGDKPLVWHEIASVVPGRTNKDCRKRWYANIATTTNKGSWTMIEDKKLCKAVQEHGTKWSVVAAEVGTRTGDQCSKRWSNTINPHIDHSAWAAKEDEQLLEGVKQHGRNWQQIVSLYFPRRTSLGAKNRYHLLCRKAEGARVYNKGKKPGTRMIFTEQNPSQSDSGESNESSSDEDEYENSSEDSGSATSRLSVARPNKKRKSDSPMASSQPWAQFKPNFEEDLKLQPAISSTGALEPTSSESLLTQTFSYSGMNFPCPPSIPGYMDPGPSEDSKHYTPTSHSESDAALAIKDASELASYLDSNDLNTISLSPQDYHDYTMAFNPDLSIFETQPQNKHQEPATYEAFYPLQDCSSRSSSYAAFVSTLPPYANNQATTTSRQSQSLQISDVAQDGSAEDIALTDIAQRRKITIEAVCSPDRLGRVVQAVLDLSLSATFKTDDPS